MNVINVPDDIKDKRVKIKVEFSSATKQYQNENGWIYIDVYNCVGCQDKILTNYNIESKDKLHNIEGKNNTKFVGYYDNPSFTGNPITTMEGLYGDKVLYPKFKELPYNITYNLDGGTLSDDAPKTYYSSKGLDKLPIPTKEGYEFKGWNKKIPYSYYSENNTWKTDGTNYWTNGSEKNTKAPPIAALAPMLSFEFELKTRGNLSFFITNPAVQGKENQVKIYKDNQLIKEIYLFEDRGYYGNSKEVNVNELLTEGRYKVEILQYYAPSILCRYFSN